MRAGQVFSFDLLDAGGGEIRCTAFNACVDKFEPLIQRDAVIILSKASLRPKKAGTVRTPPSALLCNLACKGVASAAVRCCAFHAADERVR